MRHCARSPLLTLVAVCSCLLGLSQRPTPAAEQETGLPPIAREDTQAAEHYLAGFEPFVGKTWKALVNEQEQIYDVARWERTLGGHAVRIRHAVNGGAYGGETFVVWDTQREQIVYFYFTNAGFYTTGTMQFDEAGRLMSREQVAGAAGGVSEVEAIQEVLADGMLLVRTRMLRDGKWEERPDAIYEEDPQAVVVLPDQAQRP